jgi:putative mRNA 3-end processing factor
MGWGGGSVSLTLKFLYFSREESNCLFLISFFVFAMIVHEAVLEHEDHFDEMIYMHGATYNMHQSLITARFPLPSVNVERITPETPKEKLKTAIVIAPPGAEGSPWMKKFFPYAVGVCSGWMQVRGIMRRRNVDGGFALSDHADWNGLLSAVKETGAEKIFVTHGFQSVFSRYLNEMGIWSAEVKTEYGDEAEEEAVISPTSEPLNSNAHP